MSYTHSENFLVDRDGYENGNGNGYSNGNGISNGNCNGDGNDNGKCHPI